VLCLTRKLEEDIVIYDRKDPDNTLTIIRLLEFKIGRHGAFAARIGVDGPGRMAILRREVYERDQLRKRGGGPQDEVPPENGTEWRPTAAA
jgi:sRNA-binding carbon storage regulator CsrA